MEFRSAEGMPFANAAAFDRVRYPARGAAGGRDGATGRLSRGSGAALAGKGHHSIAGDDSLIVEMAGGGGYGDPLTRDPALVARDVLNGLVSVEGAWRDYGVAVSADGALDLDRTSTRRNGGAE
jgi:N-methylhydantoinase B